jgi:MFS transporter, UMF1 family
VAAWGVYEFASNAFNTLILTFIFSRYFQSEVVLEGDGTLLWSRAVNLSAIIVALAMPVLGAAADFSGRKKAFLGWTTAGTILLTVALFWVRPGMVLEAFLIFVAANILFEAAAVFYNGFLPELASTRKMGRISGFGWGMGYVGGLLCLILALGMVQLWLPEEDGLNIRATTLLAAAWYAVFAIPFFFLVRERQKRRTVRPGIWLAAGVRRVRRTLGELRTYRQVARLLVARLVYNDGLVVIFAFASIYLGEVYGMAFGQILVMAIALNVAAGVGAISFGFVNDRLGARPTIAFTLVVLTVATLVGAWAPTIGVFWVAAMVLGLMVGPNQAASRAMLATFTPHRKQGEFFGFYAFSGKLASVAGPFVYGTVVAQTGSQRIAMASVAGFFVLGLLLLLRVDEAEGIATAALVTREETEAAG